MDTNVRSTAALLDAYGLHVAHRRLDPHQPVLHVRFFKDMVLGRTICVHSVDQDFVRLCPLDVDEAVSMLADLGPASALGGDVRQRTLAALISGACDLFLEHDLLALDLTVTAGSRGFYEITEATMAASPPRQHAPTVRHARHARTRRERQPVR